MWLQTLETPLHYVSRTGNVDTLDEIAQYMSHKILTVINKQAKACTPSTPLHSSRHIVA